MNDSQDAKKYLTLNPLKQILVNKFLNDIYFEVEQVQPKTILDIGCGEGFVDMFLFQKNPQYQIKGIDISKKTVGRVKKQAPKLMAQQGDAYNLPFRENTFDLTICMEVLEHLNEPQKAITEARRVSKKYCLFSVPREPIFSLLTFFSGKYLKRLGRHPDHVNFWTKKSFKELMQKHFSKLIVFKVSSTWILAMAEKKNNGK